MGRKKPLVKVPDKGSPTPAAFWRPGAVHANWLERNDAERVTAANRTRFQFRRKHG
jgi:hypothetical protein